MKKTEKTEAKQQRSQIKNQRSGEKKQNSKRIHQKPNSGNKKSKGKRKRLWIWLSMGTIIGCLFVYIGIAVYFNEHYLPGTTINGVDASGKNVEDVEQQIIHQTKGYEIRIEGRYEEEEIITGEDIALKTVFDGSLQKELRKQNGFAWPISLFETNLIEVETMVDYDKKAMKQKAGELKMLDKKQMEQPENAFVSEYSKEDGYKIMPEEEGTTVNKKKFLKKLGKAILNLQSSISLEEEDCYTKPTYTKESQELKDLVNKMNQYVNTVITYQFGDQEQVLDGETISQWVTHTENFEAQLSNEQVAAYVDQLAEKWNTAGKSKNLKTSYGTEVTVSGGDYGWRIDREKETQALFDLIQNGESVTREPEYDKWANSRSGNDYGDTYVEVNLTSQHLFYYKNGELILDTDFVSGNDAKGWSTPVGAYGLYYKERDKTLRGEDYATPVTYWMPFNGGVGFHDANWRSAFGGNFYKRNGSHGCVNMPFSAAQTLYENIEPGCAILVYNLSGSESAQTKAEEEAEAAREAQEAEARQAAEAEAQPVIAAIDSLGEITLERKESVINVRNQYNALSDLAKEYVGNYTVLEAAEAMIAQLETDTIDQQAQAEAQPVIDAINGLAGRGITLEMKGEIEGIRAQYNQLSEAARSKVTNVSILEEAERILSELEQQQPESEPEPEPGSEPEPEQ